MSITEEIQVMHDDENLTETEIAYALGLDLGTVRKALEADRTF